jgi:uncharacterized protein (TIGR03435 family)
MSRLSAIAIFPVLAAGLAAAQSARPPAPDGSDNDIRMANTLKGFITQAYHVAPQQVFGPSWMEQGVLDMIVHVLPGTTRDQIPLIMQNMLAQHFKLALHREKRVMKVYLLEVARAGAKLDESPVWDKSEPGCIGEFCRRISTSELAWRLQALDASVISIGPIVDRTGLTGVYDFKLPDIHRFSLGVSRNSSAAFQVKTVQDQLKALGLTLEERMEPVEILRIDHCEKRPT